MILITAPTSNIGSQVVTDLLERNASLRLVARDPSRLSSEVRDRTEVVEGSHGDPKVIGEAARGIDAAFWLTPNIPDVDSLRASYADFARPAISAFLEQGVTRVVGISALGRGTKQAKHAGHVTASLEMDDLFAGSGLAYRAVVNPSFMENLLGQAATIKEQGKFFASSTPDLKVPSVATRDIAATSARLLADDSWSGFEEVACLGKEDISANDQAAIISDVLGRDVTFVQISEQEMRDQFSSFGMSEAMVQGYVDMFNAKNEGLDNAERRTAESTTPTTFREWAEQILKPAVAAA